MKTKILSLVLLSFFITAAYPQSFVSRSIRGERGLSKQYVSLEDDTAVIFSAAKAKSLLGLNYNSDLVLQQTERDKLGFVHYRYFQTYRSIPVENSMFIFHTKNGILKSLGGTIVTDFDERINQRAQQQVSNAEAINIAVKHVNAKVYAWQNAGMERRIKQQTNNTNASYKPTAALVWYSTSRTINPRNLRLCFKVDVYATEPLSRAYYFVDAITGNVLGKEDRINNSDVTGTANTAYSGKKTIHSDYNAGKYRLRDYTKGNGVITLHGESASRGDDYTSTSANWSLSGTNIAALDAHYGVSKTYAFYFSNFERNSYDDAGTALYSYVNDPTYLDNAFWDGSSMNFNKRSDGVAGGVTGIDVCGHELTHGVTQETSALNYSYESGAMNESMSDIMGKSIQFWSKPNDTSWLLSNDMNLIFRNMANPNEQGQPDTYHGNYWYYGDADNGGVHFNSGVGNFMYYLLVEGGSGTNDNGESYAVTGIGLEHAEQILYRTNTVYLVPTSQYADWRLACINAAVDLYGANSADVTQVQNAWHAVGVGAKGGACTTPTGLEASPILNTSEALNWSDATGSIKYSLRYKEATANTWLSVNNILSSSYNLTGLKKSTEYKFKVLSVCPGSVKSDFSSVISFKTLASNPYCSVSGNTSYEYINRVRLDTIDNRSGNDSGYGIYTSMIATLTAGNSYKISLTPGFIDTVYEEYWQVYIDYNQNGDFYDEGEAVARGHGTSGINKTFVVPLTALKGKTRMRVEMQYDNYPLACGSFYGEAEDYTVKITGNNPVAESNKKENSFNSISILPNPVKGSSANLALQTLKAGAVNIMVTDLSGRMLRTEKIYNINAGKNYYALRNLKLLPGTYMVVAEQSNIIIARSRFIVEK